MLKGYYKQETSDSHFQCPQPPPAVASCNTNQDLQDEHTENEKMLQQFDMDIEDTNQKRLVVQIQFPRNKKIQSSRKGENHWQQKEI
ncbi:DNA polymerase delta subunit [Trifolium repens]|nr:DNA polymerase delta subunit [Trifolium repens]